MGFKEKILLSSEEFHGAVASEGLARSHTDAGLMRESVYKHCGLGAQLVGTGFSGGIADEDCSDEMAGNVCTRCADQVVMESKPQRVRMRARHVRDRLDGAEGKR